MAEVHNQSASIQNQNIVLKKKTYKPRTLSFKNVFFLFVLFILKGLINKTINIGKVSNIFDMYIHIELYFLHC